METVTWSQAASVYISAPLLKLCDMGQVPNFPLLSFFIWKMDVTRYPTYGTVMRNDKHLEGWQADYISICFIIQLVFIYSLLLESPP